MKTTMLIFSSALYLAVVAPCISSAQGSVTYLSNLGQATSGTVAVGSDSWIAAMFYAGGNLGGYMLDSEKGSVNDIVIFVVDA